MKVWKNISLNKKIAEVNVHNKKISGWHNFGECLETMAKTPGSCLRKGCIIGLLIRAVKK